MDLKKFLDQTVREVKREVNKKVLKVPEIEQKVYEATSNEPWGPHGTLMGDIAQATRNFNEYQMIMAILWKRLNDSGRNWRHVYKSLTVLEFLVANGAERVIDELREHTYQVQTLVDFQYMEPTGKDQGINVRKKAQSLVTLLGDRDKIREVRNKAAANRDKYRGVSSTGTFSKSSSYSSTGGGYGDSYNDEDRYGGTSRSGARDDYRYGERDSYRDDRYKDDRYRDDDRSTRDSYGDRYRDDKDRDRYEDDRYGGKGGDGYGNDKYGDEPKYEGSGSGSGFNRDRNRSFDEDERYPPRRGSGSGTKGDDSTQDDREPSGLAAAVARAHTSQSNMTQTSNNATQGPEKKATLQHSNTASVGGSYFASQPSISVDDVDDFDPRGAGAGPQESDPFGASASAQAPAAGMAPVKTTNGIEDLFGDSGFETSFVSEPAPESKPSAQANGFQTEDLFGVSAFTAEQQSTASFASATSTHFTSAPPANDMVNGNFRPFPSASTNGSNNSVSSSSFSGQSTQNSYLSPPPPAPAPVYSSTNSFQNPSGAFQAAAVPFASGSNTHGSFAQTQASVVGNPYNPTASSGGQSHGPPANQNFSIPSKPQQKSFQTKSTIWNDTISSGLVDLNISGPKTNPLAELGIDLKDSIFSAQEKRREEKAQPTAGHMGKAMGSGTGMGLAGAGGIAQPPVPSVMGMGMGGGMAKQPSMGIGMGVNAGYGGGPGMGPGFAAAPGMSGTPGYGVPPGMGVGQGMTMNPGMGGYGPGMGMVQGGYGPGLGMGGYPNQQYSGYR